MNKLPVKKTNKKPRVGDGTPGPGRPKGAPNKLTSSFKQAIAIVYDRMGGHDAFLAWAKQNETEFYKIAARLIPVEVGGVIDLHVFAVPITRREQLTEPEWERRNI